MSDRVFASDRTFSVLAVVVGGVWASYVLVFGSDAGLSVPALLTLTWGGAAVAVLYGLRLVVHLGAHRGTIGRFVPRLIAEAAILMICFALVWTGAAFRLRFMLSRPALERFAGASADRIAGGRFTPGTRVGLFWLREAEFRTGGVVRIITTECMLDDCGLAYSPGGQPPVIGEDSYHPLSAGWYQWRRSW